MASKQGFMSGPPAFSGAPLAFACARAAQFGLIAFVYIHAELPFSFLRFWFRRSLLRRDGQIALPLHDRGLLAEEVDALWAGGERLSQSFESPRYLSLILVSPLLKLLLGHSRCASADEKRYEYRFYPN